jgi:redox-sensitive bicupin YhaK (pirin superfamily)
MSENSPVEMVIDARRRDLGGFEVGRVLPWASAAWSARSCSSITWDRSSSPRICRAAVDVRPHPHIGLSTITYLFAGEIVHRDSLGFHQVIRPGEVNWMTAGRGISHSERFETMREHGGLLHGIQAWIALPRSDEEIAPEFVHYEADALPLERSAGASTRVIAGKAFGKTSPVRTQSALVYVHVELQAGRAAGFQRATASALLSSRPGTIRVGEQSYAAGQMACSRVAVNRE